MLLFPKASALSEGQMMRQLGDHIDLCKECCEVLGMTQNTLPYHPSSPNMNAPVPAILVKPIPQGSSGFDVSTYLLVNRSVGCCVRERMSWHYMHDGWMDELIDVRMYVRLYVCTYTCMYVHTYRMIPIGMMMTRNHLVPCGAMMRRWMNRAKKQNVSIMFQMMMPPSAKA